MGSDTATRNALGSARIDALQENTHVSAVAFHAVTRKKGESYAVITQPWLGYIELLFSRPDQEDEIYIAPFWFARDIPGLDLPKVE